MDETVIIPSALDWLCNDRPVIAWRIDEDGNVDPVTVDGVISERPYKLKGPFEPEEPLSYTVR